MLDPRTIWSQTQSILAWTPGWLAGILILVVAVVAALLAHLVLIGIARRIVGTRGSFLAALVVRTRAAIRLALLVFGVSAALQVAPFDPAVRAAIGHVLVVAFILLVGWFAIIAVHLAAETYLRRFQLDTADNLLARKHITQVRILQRSADTLVFVITLAAALVTFESVRQYGVSLFASAGVVGLAVGLAARPVLSNLIAGVQIAMTQPIRLEDAVIVENEFGWIEEIAAAYVVIRIWDQRRLIVPLSYFIEKPFQNWTRQNPELIGTVDLYLDYAAPVDRIREKLDEIVSRSPLWDRRVAKLQVADAKETTILVRALVSAKNAGALGALLAREGERHVDEKHHQAGDGDIGADRGDVVPVGECVGVVDDAARHAGEPQEMLRKERDVDADERDPEMQLAERFVISVAGHFREPIVPAGEDREHGAEREHVMEMRHHVVGVLQQAVDAGIRQHHAGDAADGEQENEADRPQHRGLELDRAAPHGGDP